MLLRIVVILCLLLSNSITIGCASIEWERMDIHRYNEHPFIFEGTLVNISDTEGTFKGSDSYTYKINKVYKGAMSIGENISFILSRCDNGGILGDKLMVYVATDASGEVMFFGDPSHKITNNSIGEQKRLKEEVRFLMDVKQISGCMGFFTHSYGMGLSGVGVLKNGIAEGEWEYMKEDGRYKYKTISAYRSGILYSRKRFIYKNGVWESYD